jgi:hypothetical protein
MNTVFEGATLDILHGVAVFTSGLTGHVITSRNLKDIKNANDDNFVILIQGLSERKWFDKTHETQLREFVNKK